MIYYKTEKYELRQGDMREELSSLTQNSIDCIVTDPPYELNFMGKGWDNAGVSFSKETWEKCLRVLKPGGYLLAFGGSRTFHRIACAIEDAGFEIRDTIMWLYGSGFPKGINIAYAIESKMKIGSANKADQKMLDGEKGIIALGYHKTNASSGYRPHDYSGQETTVKPNITTEEAKRWQGWHSNLKPAYEPIIVARKPCEGGIIDNVLKYGVGGLNIDECRVSISQEDIDTINAKSSKSPTSNYNQNVAKKYGDYALNIATLANEQGRYPANLILSYDENDFDEVCGGFPNSGNGNNTCIYNYTGREYNNKETSMFNGDKPSAPSNYNDNGSASRYFYCAKASKRDRNEGLDENVCNIHPTVKPQSLLGYLVRLVAPKGATILDPFMGSGSTGKAVMYENKDRNADYKFIGIELTEEYLSIAKARIDFAIGSSERVSPIKAESAKEESAPKRFNILG